MKLSLLLFLSYVTATVGSPCGFDDCHAGQSCCAGEMCYNAAIDVCATCLEGVYPCPIKQPNCCVRDSEIISSHKCYGEGQKCCTETGVVANNTDFCIGQCGKTSDPFTKCCGHTTYVNTTQCCSGSGQPCKLETDICDTCGCTSKTDTQTGCCGARRYTKATEQCCGHDLVCAHGLQCSGCGCLGSGMKCCGTKQYNATAGQSCCEGTYLPAPPIVCSATETCEKQTVPGGGMTFPVCCPNGKTCQ